MNEISLGLLRGEDRCGCGDQGRALRILLAGQFATAWSERRLHLERLLLAASAEYSHQVVPVGRPGSELEQAARQLRIGMVDVVLLDLGGPISGFLTLVGQLRASAGPDVVFIGLHAGDDEPETAGYRSAVVDAVLYSCSSGAVLQRGIAEAVEAIRNLDDASFATNCPAGMLRQ